MAHLSLEIDDQYLEAFGKSDEERRDFLAQAIAIANFQTDRWSSAYCCHFLKIGRMDFLGLRMERGIPERQTAQDIMDGYQAIERLFPRKKTPRELELEAKFPTVESLVACTYRISGAALAGQDFAGELNDVLERAFPLSNPLSPKISSTVVIELRELATATETKLRAAGNPKSASSWSYAAERFAKMLPYLSNA